MSTEFSATISNLRKDKNISQKDAAQALGISQALLSHYEKGIRECSLDFVKKAAEFYEVTSDYLLGISENKHMLNDVLSQENLPDDRRITTKTIIRSLIRLSEQAETEGDDAQIFFENYFSVCIRKYMAIENRETDNTEKLCDIVSLLFSEERKNQATNSEFREDMPLVLETVSQHCNMLISKKINSIM